MQRGATMLVLSRKVGQRIVLPQCGITITVLGIQGNRVRVGIDAPASIDVFREEVLDDFDPLLRAANGGVVATEALPAASA